MAINLHHNSPLGANKVESTQKTATSDSFVHGSEALDSKSDKVKLDKSNILMLGPTGSGKVIEEILKKFYMHIIYLYGEYSCIDAFVNNNNGQLRLVSGTKQGKTFRHLWYLVTTNSVQLTISNTVTKHDDLLRECVIDLKIKVHSVQIFSCTSIITEKIRFDNKIKRKV